MKKEDGLIRSYARTLRLLEEYQGECGACNKPIWAQNFMVLLVGKKLDGAVLVLALENFQCPHCGSGVGIIEVYGWHIPGTSESIEPPKKTGLN